MKLVIVESPAKAKTIEKYLGEIDSSGHFRVRASVGHVRDLPKSNKKAIDIPGGFVPHYEVVPGKELAFEAAVAGIRDRIGGRVTSFILYRSLGSPNEGWYCRAHHTMDAAARPTLSLPPPFEYPACK